MGALWREGGGGSVLLGGVWVVETGERWGVLMIRRRKRETLRAEEEEEEGEKRKGKEG